MGWQCITSPSSDQYKLREQAGMNFDNEGFGRINGRYVIACTTTFGKTGDYIDFYQEDGTVIQCIIGDIKSQNDAGCTEWGHNNGQCIIEFVVNKDTWYNCGHPNPGQEGFHMEWNQNLTKAINGGSYFDNPSFGGSTIQGNGSQSGSNSVTSSGNSTISGSLMKWPTDGTTITSYFGLRNDVWGGSGTENHGAIDIGVPTGTNVYATEAGTVTYAAMCGTAGNLVTIDHGNGYITKYMHNSVFKVSVGDKVEKGQVIALSGSTGNSTGPHVHFQIEYNGVKVDPLTFKYDNGMGDGTSGFGSNSGSLSTNSTIYAKVATWNETTDKIESDDPEVSKKNETRYNMTTTKVNYQELVSGYKMPFDYLWALLVVGQEKNFVFDLADLVYNSQIEITVHDNLTKTTNVSVDTYTKKTKVVTSDVKVKVNYSDVSTTSSASSGTSSTTSSASSTTSSASSTTTHGSATETGGPFEKELEKTYKTTHTVITKTNTLDTKLTKANVWIVDYSQDFAYQTPAAVVTPSSVPYDDEEYPETPNKTDGNDGAGLGESFRKSVQSKYASQHTTATASIESLKSEYYNKTVNRNVNITNTVESKKYVSSPAKIVEKTDKQAKEPNFATLYVKYRKFQNNIGSAAEWLFQILEKGPNTVDMVDLTKYLLYKASGRSYGVKEYDFSVYNPKEFKTVSTGGSDLLRAYIRNWEHSTPPPTNADGTKYIIERDPAGYAAVGYGIDIFNGGYADLFKKSGYPTNIGGEVDKEFVDNLEKQTIESMTEKVRAITAGLNLSEYQIHALVSRSYNCGVSGALTTHRGSPSLDFVNSYNRYWKQNTDSLFEKKDNNANFSHSLYTQYMAKPVTSNGEYFAGLERRRKSEWRLFQTGYYDTLDKWYQEGGSLVNAAYEVAEHFINAGNIHYAGSDVAEATNNGRHCIYNDIQGSWDKPVQNPSQYGVVCATYVSLALWKAGLVDEATINQYGYNGCSELKRMLSSGSYASQWQKISSFGELKEGDIVFNQGYAHVWIYIDGGKCLDQNYCVISSSGSDSRGSLKNANSGNFLEAYRYTGK